MSTWVFVLTDLDFVPLGELNDFTGMSVTRGILRVDSASFRVRGDHRFAEVLASNECYLKGYRNGRLEFFGPVHSTEMVGDQDKVSLAVQLIAEGNRASTLVVWAEPGAEPPGGAMYGYFTEGTVDRGLWLSTAGFDQARYHTSYGLFAGRFDALHIPFAASGTSFDVYASEPGIRPTLTEVLETATGGLSGGFEWMWEPTEVELRDLNLTPTRNAQGVLAADPYTLLTDPLPGGTHRRTIATLKTAARIGTERDAAFEYGTGRFTLAGFKMVRTNEYMANRHWLNNPATETTGISGQDSTSIVKWGPRDLWGGRPDNYDDAVDLGNLAVELRKDPRRRLEITPRATVGALTDPPEYGVDYELGDTVFASIATDNGSLLHGRVRVYGATFELGDGVSEVVSLTVVDEA